MIFRNFKRKVCVFFFRRRIKHYDRNAFNFDSDKISSLIVLTNDEYNHQVIPIELSELLGLPLEKITSVYFRETKPKDRHFDDLITLQEYKWNGKLNHKIAKKYLNTQYDLMINYCNENEMLANLFTLQCNSLFNIAFNHHNKKLSDLTIHCDKEDLNTFNNEIKKYLTIFNKKTA